MLETVKKLRWAPDIIHCQGWISQVLPLYLKKGYKDDPIFSNAKIVLSLYDYTDREPFAPGFDKTLLFGGIKAEDAPVGENAGGMELAQLAARYADGIIIGAEGVDPALQDFCKGLEVPVLPFDGPALSDGSYMDQYNDFYDLLLK